MVVGRDEAAGFRARLVTKLQHRLGSGQLACTRREPPLDRRQPCLGDAALVVDLQPPERRQPVDPVVGVGSQQPPRAVRQLGTGEMAVPVVLGQRQRVHDACVQPPRMVGRHAERLRQRVGRREPDPLELRERVRIGLQLLDRPRTERPVDARGHCRRHAVAVQEQPQGAQTALLTPRFDGRADAPRADPRRLEQQAVRVAVDDRQHLGPVSLEQPARAALADMLDRAQVREQRVLADRLAHAHALGRELPAVLGVPAERAADVDHLAGLHVGERARHGHLLALVGHPDEDREVAVRQPPADGGDLQRELGSVGVLHRTASVVS